jgi:hypothetical protein
MSGILQTFAYGRAFSIIPANTVAPVVSGTATVGQTLSTTNGTWSGIPTPTFTYQWQRAGSNIGSATASTYVLVAADAGSTIRCVVTATNTVGSTSANSNSTAAVAATVPGAPTIGTATATSSTAATVSYTAPASNGGATITSYTATSSPGGITGSLSTAGSGTITVSGLTPSTSYTFVVRATNSAGNSANSGSSNSITTSASYWISLGALANSSPSVASAARVVGSNLLTTMNGVSGSTGVSGTSVSTATGGFAYGVLGGSGGTILPYSMSPYPPIQITTTESVPTDGLFDSSGNQYSFGAKAVANYMPRFSKTNSSGSKQWGLSIGTTESGGINSAQFDQGGYISAVGSYNGSMFLTRVSEGGSVLLCRTNNTTTTQALYGADVDGSGNIYIAGMIRNSSSGVKAAGAASFTSDLSTVRWRRNYFPNGSNNDNNQGSIRVIKLVGSDVYMGGTIIDQGSYKGLIMKVDSSTGEPTWLKGITIAGVCSIEYGSDGYLYWGCTGSNTGGYDRAHIIKTDTSGNVVWQRRVDMVSSSQRVGAIRATISGSTMFIAGTYGEGSFYPLYMKVPSNGSLTGNYSVGGYTVSYSAGSLTFDTPNIITTTSAFFFYNTLTTTADDSTSSTLSTTVSTVQI